MPPLSSAASRADINTVQSRGDTDLRSVPCRSVQSAQSRCTAEAAQFVFHTGKEALRPLERPAENRQPARERWTTATRRRRCSSRESDVREAWPSGASRACHGGLKHRLLRHRRQHASARWKLVSVLDRLARRARLVRSQLTLTPAASYRRWPPAARRVETPSSRRRLRQDQSAAPTPSTIDRPRRGIRPGASGSSRPSLCFARS